MRRSNILTAAALCLTLCAWLLVLGGSAAAKVTHQREGVLPLEGVINSLSVDNSEGPSKGDLYIGEIKDLTSFATRVYQVTAGGIATGVELDGPATPAGSFGFVNTETFGFAGGPAVDNSTGPRSGDVYVPDVVHGVVDLFDESGSYICQITGSATPSSSECAGAVGSETPRGAIEPLAVAVDPGDGEVVVGDSSGVLYEFNEAGEYEAEIADPNITEPGSLAIDSAGDIYVVDVNPFFETSSAAFKFGPTGNFEYALGSGRISVGIDLSDNQVYLGGEGGPTEEFDAAGNPVSAFGSTGPAGGVRSIGLDETTGQVFLTPLSGTEGQIWSGGVLLPTVTTAPAVAIGATAATLGGEVDPEIAQGGSPIESCRFEYVDDREFQESEWAGAKVMACSPPTPYPGTTAASAAVTGLAPSTTYHFRLAAVNESGAEGVGEARSFTTSGPASISGEISIARTNSATVKAQINPFGLATNCEVEYVDEARFAADGYAGAARVPCAEALSAGFEGETVSAQLIGLEIGTEYHYRFVAHNSSSAGTTVGEDEAFSTFGIESFSIETLDRGGLPYTQAGGHPYELKVSIAMATTAVVGTPPPGQVGNQGSVTANLRTVRVSLPPGLIGNPTAAPKCDAFLVKFRGCAAATQVGHAVVDSARGTSEDGAVYNLVPPDGVAAQLGARFNNVGVARIDAGVRTGSDYGVDADTLAVTADEGVSRIEMVLWGVPADEGHFGERFCLEASTGGCPSDAPARPFLTNPTACSGPLAASLAVDAWQEPENFVSATSPVTAMTGCGRLDFKPTVRVQPETTIADSPTGLNVDLHVPQNENPLGLAEADLKDAVVTLPRGVMINPAGADGLEGCSPAQIELHGPGPAGCPDAAKVGSVEVDTPLVDHPLQGGVYVAQQGNAGPAHGANPFGSLLAIYIAVADPQTGVVVKLAGDIEPDPVTGQLTTTFDENPQLPFEDFKLDFFGGSRAALSTPVTCGSYTTDTRLTPWSAPEGADAIPSDTFQVVGSPGGANCASDEGQLSNAPAFEAGTVTPLAGAFSPFVLKLSRPDGSQRLSRVDASLPPGLTGKLAGIPYCPAAAIATAEARNRPGDGGVEETAPSCPRASEVGSVEVAAGTGGSPLVVRGHVYLAGPYKGAPLSLVILTPAVAGPFDLGVVVVRTALYVDPETAQITAKSDPLPTMLEGIPLDVRSILLRMDRPGFTLNPTSCEAMLLGGTATSTVGQAAILSTRFQVGGCAGLPFKPALKLQLTGATKRVGHPGLKATLSAKPGESNIGRAQVNLPHGEFLDQGNLNKTCTKPVLLAGNCPKSSVYGEAKAWTPLLEKPLQGNVYLVGGYGYKLPALVAELNGQIRVLLVGKVDTGPNKGIRNTFEVVPDAPVSRFVLELKGGKKYGLLENSENLCKASKAKRRAIVRFTGQNGKVEHFKPVVTNHCGVKRQKKQ
jgi:hypothetical protein